mgnify:CR=1 FL=1
MEWNGMHNTQNCLHEIEIARSSIIHTTRHQPESHMGSVAAIAGAAQTGAAARAFDRDASACCNLMNPTSRS